MIENLMILGKRILELRKRHSMTQEKLANEMIINTNMQIQEIATKLAFTDSHHFSTAFKKFNGISPKEYRNKHHKG